LAADHWKSLIGLELGKDISQGLNAEAEHNHHGFMGARIKGTVTGGRLKN
jgi:hypothetical protein